MTKPTEESGKPQKHPGGRPSAYRSEYSQQVSKLCELGADDKQIADFFGVSEVTVNAWKQKHPEFLKSLKDAKEAHDTRVERSLLERAVGYSHPDTHISNYQGEITITPITKHYPPDPTSMIFWLKNRQPERWKDKVEHDVNAKITETIREVIRVPEGTE